MFHGKLDDKGDNPGDNQDICTVKGDNRLSPGLHPMTTGHVFEFCFIRFRDCMFCT